MASIRTILFVVIARSTIVLVVLGIATAIAVALSRADRNPSCPAGPTPAPPCS